MASGLALARRWRKPAEKLPDDHPAWELEAAYIAYALVNVIVTLSPQRIVLGGGVMEHQPLVPSIQSDDLTPGNSGVRAQAVGANGKPIDDFVIESHSNAIHVLNAPSPAATALPQNPGK